VNAPIRLGVAIPQTFHDRPVEPRGIREFLQRADALGFESAWVLEQILGRIPALESVGLLTYAAAVTERLRLGAAVLLTALRSPVHLAKSLATLDHLSRGRLIVGVGLGGDRILSAFGIAGGARADRFAESVRLMKRLWTEPRVTVEGPFWTLREGAMEPKPVQQPHPPIWFGGHHPNALRRAVELGSGFVGAGAATTAAFAGEVRALRGLLAEAGRDPASFVIAKRVYIAIDEDRARAARRLAEWFGAFYGKPEMAERVAVWGPVDACVEGLRAVVAGGAGLLILNPVFDEQEHLERFASEIAPKL
jgi:alkanesulfonate monooxygenase SsuD/methylene tetrahydromethanopterin reductase-like flavin-dependent oxidoreductase (luciferase family)